VVTIFHVKKESVAHWLAECALISNVNEF